MSIFGKSCCSTDSGKTFELIPRKALPATAPPNAVAAAGKADAAPAATALPALPNKLPTPEIIELMKALSS